MSGLAQDVSDRVAQTRRTKLLTGAPQSSSLDWSEESLTASLLPVFQDFLQEQGTGQISVSIRNETNSSGDVPTWRIICLNTAGDLPPKRSQSQGQRNSFEDYALRLDTTNINFLNHSLAVLTQLEGQGGETLLDVASLPTEYGPDTGATFSFRSDSLSEDESMLQPVQIVLPGKIANLSAIPSASHIQRIQPQTITVNLIAGIISLSSPRRVRIPRSGREVEIVELLLGDETKAGFTVTIWLPLFSTSRKTEEQSLRTAVERLQLQDVILIKDLALNAWNGRVYGQSLSRRFAKVETQIGVICRPSVQNVETQRAGSASPIQQKIADVVKWVERFVGIGVQDSRMHLHDGGAAAKRDFASAFGGEILPPDTQANPQHYTRSKFDSPDCGACPTRKNA